MITSLRRAFTLIELLIVLAIIAIITASSMAVITGPMYERVRAEDEEAFDAGAGLLYATLLQDAHHAVALDASTTGTIVFTRAMPTTGTIVYAVDAAGSLTRKTPEQQQVAKLVPAVQSFLAERQHDGQLWTVNLTGRLHGYREQPAKIERRMKILVGESAWTGGAL